jgi:hypothetical protein
MPGGRRVEQQEQKASFAQYSSNLCGRTPFGCAVFPRRRSRAEARIDIPEKEERDVSYKDER